MTHSVVGVRDRLHHDWHKDLTPVQLAAYIRYQFVYLNEHVIDWDAPAHKYNRRAWREGDQKTRDGSRRSSTWYEVLRKISQTESTTGQPVFPGIWVHAHFSPVAEKKLNQWAGLTDMRPSVLHADMAPYIYAKYLELGPEIISQNYELAVDTLQLRLQATASFEALPAFRDRRLTLDDRMAYVLCDEAYVTATPFFRYLLAAKHDCSLAQARYLYPAAVHYEANQTLYDSFGWDIPEDLARTVTQIRQHWSTYCG
jgi:hypothetical protein